MANLANTPIAMRQTRYNVSLFMFATVLYTTVASATTKQGLAYISGIAGYDLSVLISAKTPISWYHGWTLDQTPNINSTIEFVPMIPNLDLAEPAQFNSVLSGAPDLSTHLLTFNEPDGTTDSGGSAIDPDDAARSYIDNLVPLRSNTTRAWNISHPAVTGSTQGLDWLRSFNSSCYDLDPAGCPTDFVAVHWYGDAVGLQSWLTTLYDFYNPDNSTNSTTKFWITEFALPQGDENATVTMLEQSMAFLDKLDYVEKYAWFGAFRTNAANSFTGSEVALFDDNGGLTELGSVYLGGDQNGFVEGMKGPGNNGAGTLSASAWGASIVAGLAIMLTMW
jgi:hypothetical protein